MKILRTSLFITLALSGTLLLTPHGGLLHADPAASASSATPQIVAAADKLLATISEEQRAKLIFDFQDAAQRKHWSNLPDMAVHRAGLRMGDLTPAQRDAVHALLAAALSPEGYEKTLQIVQGDELLKKNDRGGPPPRGDRGGPPPGGNPNGPGPGGDRQGPPPAGGRNGRGGGAIFGQDEYFISFLGKPSATEPWMIQFGGHHLGLNITIAGEHGTLAPSHTGSQPAHYEIEGKAIRPLGRESDKAFALLSSLDEGQRKQAILGATMHDLVLGPGHDGQVIQPEGIKGSALTDQQRDLLLDLASEWINIMNPAVAQAKMAEIKKNIADTWFTWSGPMEKGGAAYFRVQGPSVLIEYAPQRLGGDPTNHIHTIYRDPTNDYGAQWWKK